MNSQAKWRKKLAVDFSQTFGGRSYFPNSGWNLEAVVDHFFGRFEFHGIPTLRNTSVSYNGYIYISSGQIIATSQDLGPQNVAEEGKSHYFREI